MTTDHGLVRPAGLLPTGMATDQSSLRLVVSVSTCLTRMTISSPCMVVSVSPCLTGVTTDHLGPGQARKPPPDQHDH
eukprot:13946697-Alexandrium_andersonii.AAC.1